jgi:glycosyltransferase involved in cell wall biosynthesis
VTRPWLSVVVPTCNGAAYLPLALDSVVAEADPGVAVIAVDDGSTDETGAILDRYRPRLNLDVIHRRAGNWVANTNLGLRRATGDFACFLHQDDYWLPGRLPAVRQQLAATPDVSLLLHACRFVDRAGRPLGSWRCPYPAQVPMPPAFSVERLLVQNFVGIPGAVFRRDLALAVGGLDDTLWYTADWDLWLKLASAGPTAYVPQLLAAFRVHPKSQTAARSRSLDDFRRQMEVMAERHLDRWPAPHPATRSAVARVARASVEVNVGLAAAYHRQPVPWRRLARALAPLGLSDWHRLLRDSRLWERVSARVRARIAPPG